MTIPKYIYCQGEGLGAGIILINQELPLIGSVIKFNSYTEMISQVNAGKFIAYYIIPGYSILIAYGGIFGRGNRLIGNNNDFKGLSDVLKDMGLWYYDYKIINHLAAYKRYLLQG